jgi:peptide deformylase
MAILKIIQPDNPILRQKARKVQDFGPKFQTLVDNMFETLIDAPGVGLAAPQVAEPLRLILVRLMDDEDSIEEFGDEAGKLYVLANPEIIRASKEMVDGTEACLSIPGWYGTVERHEKVTVKGQDRHGKALRIKADGWQARVFQHEIDHLDGRLYVDIASKIWEAPPESETEAESSTET